MVVINTTMENIMKGLNRFNDQEEALQVLPKGTSTSTYCSIKLRKKAPT